ncbi:MAG: translesion error-prone DNA polymerase V autoproteolytic subunit [Pseudomonadota bacterium]
MHDPITNKTGRGGVRPGAGRPKGQGRWGEPTVTLRVPESRVGQVRDFLEVLHERRAEAAEARLPGLFERAGLVLLRPAEVPESIRLPLFGHKIAAGFPSPADDYVEDRIDLNQHLIRHREATFFLRVTGDSMLGAGIHDGDLLVVDRALDPADGKIVIAVLDGELTVKRLERRGGRVRLLPENPAFPAIEVSNEQDLVIWGVVTSVIHGL